MLKFYICHFNTYNNGELVHYENGGYILTEDVLSNEQHRVDWNNLNDIYEKFGFFCGFGVWNLKRGRVVSFYDISFFNKNKKDVKEWKHPLNIIIEIKYREINPTMEQLKHFDAVSVKKYLDERG